MYDKVKKVDSSNVKSGLMSKEELETKRLFDDKQLEMQKVISRVVKEGNKKLIDDVLRNPIYDRICDQIEKGLIKYNTPVRKEHYSMRGWFEHLQQEMTDGLVYNQLLLAKTEDAINILRLALLSSDPKQKDELVKDVLSILEDGSNG